MALFLELYSCLFPLALSLYHTSYYPWWSSYNWHISATENLHEDRRNKKCGSADFDTFVRQADGFYAMLIKKNYFFLTASKVRHWNLKQTKIIPYMKITPRASLNASL